MDKPKVGQTLYSLNTGYRYRVSELEPVTVTKVGRKYFTIGEGWRAQQFYIDTWQQKTDYTSDIALYASPQEWEDEKETSEICSLIYTTFRYGNNPNKISLDKLRKIKDLIAK